MSVVLFRPQTTLTKNGISQISQQKQPNAAAQNPNRVPSARVQPDSVTLCHICGVRILPDIRPKAIGLEYCRDAGTGAGQSVTDGQLHNLTADR